MCEMRLAREWIRERSLRGRTVYGTLGLALLNWMSELTLKFKLFLHSLLSHAILNPSCKFDISLVIMVHISASQRLTDVMTSCTPDVMLTSPYMISRQTTSETFSPLPRRPVSTNVEKSRSNPIRYLNGEETYRSVIVLLVVSMQQFLIGENATRSTSS